MLSEAGITGTSDEDVVNKWFHPLYVEQFVTREERLDYGMREQRDNSDVTGKRH